MLYNKQLNNLDELKAEKKLLRKKIALEQKESGSSHFDTRNIVQNLSEQIAGPAWTKYLFSLGQVIIPYFIQKKSKEILISKGKEIALDIFAGYTKWKILSFALNKLFRKIKERKKEA